MRNCGARSAANGNEPSTTRRAPNSECRTPNSSGFTLLEVMVAVSIMAMVLVTLLGLKNRSMQDVMAAEHITTATMLAKREMAKIITTHLSSNWTPDEQEGDFTGEEYFSGYTWKKTISLIPLFGSTVVTDIRVAVLWKEGTRQEMVELVDYE